MNEISIDNNVIVLQADSGPLPTTATSVDATDALSLLAVVGAAALFGALTLRRRLPRFAESPK